MPSTLPSARAEFVVLHGRASTLVIEAHADEAPIWRYWGARLPDGTTPGLARRETRPQPSFTLEFDQPLTVLPTIHRRRRVRRAEDKVHHGGKEVAEMKTRFHHKGIVLTEVKTGVEPSFPLRRSPCLCGACLSFNLRALRGEYLSSGRCVPRPSAVKLDGARSLQEQAS